MNQEHPITPPPELVQQWTSNFYGAATAPGEASFFIATQAARWGADQELEACCEWFVYTHPDDRNLGALRAARRPKPLSLKEMCLMHLSVMERDGHYIPEILGDLRRALEALPE